MTLAQLYTQGRKMLEQPSADFDLSQLFNAQFGKTGSVINPQEEVPGEEVFIFTHKVKRLAGGYPLQYLLGEWEFYSIPLKVGEGVLIPRADTETVVDEALAILRGYKNPVVADFCAGSGAISIALACNTPQIEVHAIELSADALEYLRENVKNCGASKKITIHVQDVLDYIALPRLDLIVSNPPYLTTQEMVERSVQVKWEPEMALDAGADGLLYYRAISLAATKLLNKGGAIVFECGYRQAEDVEDILTLNGFVDIKIIKDYGDNDRCISAKLNI